MTSTPKVNGLKKLVVTSDEAKAMKKAFHIASGQRAWEVSHAAKRRKRFEQELEQNGQQLKFRLGEIVRVIRDHDGLTGRWVGLEVEIAAFYRGLGRSLWRFPWVVKSASGSEMYASSEMLETTSRD